MKHVAVLENLYFAAQCRMLTETTTSLSVVHKPHSKIFPNLRCSALNFVLPTCRSGSESSDSEGSGERERKPIPK